MREVGERGEVGKGHLVEFWWQIRGLYTWGKGSAPLFVRLTWDLMCHADIMVCIYYCNTAPVNLLSFIHCMLCY